MALKKTLIIISVIILVIAFTLFGLTKFSLTGNTAGVSGGTTVEIDTGIACNNNDNCRTNSELPSYSYCKENTCRFVDQSTLMGDFNVV